MIWRYLLAEPADSALRCETWLAEDEFGDITGYFRLPDYHFDEELAVNEVSRLNWDAALAVLHQLKALAAERGKPGIRLNLPAAYRGGWQETDTFAVELNTIANRESFALCMRFAGDRLEFSGREGTHEAGFTVEGKRTS